MKTMMIMKMQITKMKMMKMTAMVTSTLVHVAAGTDVVTAARVVQEEVLVA
jgi:hypothetical protein